MSSSASIASGVIGPFAAARALAFLNHVARSVTLLAASEICAICIIQKVFWETGRLAVPIGQKRPFLHESHEFMTFLL